MSKPLNILVTGASGTVGREVVHQLCELRDKAKVTVFDKPSKISERFFSEKCKEIQVIYGDISKKEDVAKACMNMDMVIHLAAVIPPLADQRPQLAKNVNILGTKNLIESLEGSSPEAFLIYASSISVYGDRLNDPWINVSDKLMASDRDEYALTKIEAEKLVVSSRLKWSVFRLTAIMGTNNHKASGIMFHMPLETKMEISTPADTARAFVNAIGQADKLDKKIFNLGGGEKCRISYREFLSRSFNIFGLGEADFQEHSFAKRNFHCGYYADGDALNDILGFRKDTVDDYFLSLKKSVSPVKRSAASIFRKIIKNKLQRQSEPLAAMKNKNEIDIKHYF
jgi:nucleoside-diphosphate-sugar epimerase